MSELRPYQEDTLGAIRDTVRQKVTRICLQAPTGSGKTRVAADIVDGALRKGNRIAFVVPAISLVDQAVEMFWAEGIKDIGVIQQEHQLTNWSKPCQVCSIQTIHARKRYPEAQVVVYDECHQLHKAHIRWMTHPDWANVPFLGLSATPWTKGLGKYFQSLLVMCTTKELIDLGFLSSFRVFAADHPDLSGVKVMNTGDYNEGQLAAVMNQNKLTANIIETYKSNWGKGKTLLFAVDRAHAQTLQERFNSVGIKCGYQDANTSLADRAALKRAFHAGEIEIIANVGTMTTGIDYDVRCLILARPTRSEMLYVQILGRALRIAEGKTHAVILDHTDTTARLGFVTDIHHEALDGGKMDTNKKPAKRLPPLPSPCPKCACLLAVGQKICPECGFERKITSKIIEREGTLIELNPNGRPKNRRDPREYPYTYDEKRQFYLQLRCYEQMRKFRPNWAKACFREKFREWPAWSWEVLPPADRVGAEVMHHVKARFQAWRDDPRNPRNRPDVRLEGSNSSAAGVAQAATGGAVPGPSLGAGWQRAAPGAPAPSETVPRNDEPAGGDRAKDDDLRLPWD